jgi:pimeloyl-ACP methyl ester carboxylesterase
MGIVLASAVLLIVAIVVALTVKGNIEASQPALESDYYTAFTSDFPIEERYSQRGDEEVARTELKGEAASGTTAVWYPQQLETGDKRYPMVLVVNASNSPASTYEPFFERLASWGFVVVGTEEPQSGTGEAASIALDTILEAPSDTVLFDRIDADNVGIVGYSQGGAGALRAATEFDNGAVFKAIFTASAPYPVLAENLGWGYDISRLGIPYFMTAGTGSSDDAGVKDVSEEFGGVSPLSGLVENYDAMTDDVLKIRARVAGAEHDEMLTLTDGYMTAWMLYQLKGDTTAGSVFIGEDAELLANTNWQDVEKNQ